MSTYINDLRAKAADARGGIWQQLERIATEESWTQNVERNQRDQLHQWLNAIRSCEQALVTEIQTLTDHINNIERVDSELIAMADAASERLFELTDFHDSGSQRLASDLGHLVADRKVRP